MAEKRDYYEVLGLQKGASEEVSLKRLLLPMRYNEVSFFKKQQST